MYLYLCQINLISIHATVCCELLSKLLPEMVALQSEELQKSQQTLVHVVPLTSILVGYFHRLLITT